jgi:NAD(P)-dependent dehydrogenase (short-subunit alcohol dehydrogenase family)
MKLEGRVVAVTGAGGGIGRAVALRLAAEGASVAALDVNEAAARETASAIGVRAIAVEIDVAASASVDRAMGRIESAFGPVDILANVAGIYGKHAPIREQDLENWRRVLGVNLSGTFLCSQRVLRKMIERRWGRIVNVASGHALGPRPNVAPYTASKAAVIGFTKALALEVAARGVTVNAIMPGVTDTPMPRQYGSEERLAQLARANPMGRIGRPDDIAGAIAFLASDDAEYITGQTIAVNGGVRQLP